MLPSLVVIGLTLVELTLVVIIALHLIGVPDQSFGEGVFDEKTRQEETKCCDNLKEPPEVAKEVSKLVGVQVVHIFLRVSTKVDA